MGTKFLSLVNGQKTKIVKVKDPRCNLSKRTMVIMFDTKSYIIFGPSNYIQ